MSAICTTPDFFAELDRQADEMRKKIRSTKTEVTYTGKAYYVSADGDDRADGSITSPWATTGRVSDADLAYGDAVFFRRGDTFRGKFTAKQGVTYSAYGEGDKPNIYGSLYDMADPKKWILTDTPNVYKYDATLCDDIGALIFDGGEQCGIKVVKLYNDDKTESVNHETGEPFYTYRDLCRDLNFWHAYRADEEKALYLCSTQGNPGERFGSIEFSPKGNILTAARGVTVDNLCFKYGGSHGVACGSTENLTVQNCEFGWIGGSIQGEFMMGRLNATRFGNGVEIYGGCKNYAVTDCLFYEIYDAAITHQMNAGGKLYDMENVLYARNLIEKSVYSIEYFLSSVGDSGSTMRNIVIEDNICRLAGYGWGSQRPDKYTPAHIKGWYSDNPADGFVIRRNVFDRSSCGLIQADCASRQSEPVLDGNTYIQHEGGQLGDFGKMHATRFNFYTHSDTVIQNIFGDKNARVYIVK